MGLLGAGGSVLTVPIFVYVLGVAPKPAIAMSLGVVGATAAFAALSHLRLGFVSFRIAATFAPAAMIGAFFGARVASLLQGWEQLAGFASVLLISAVLMLRDARKAEAPGQDIEDAARRIDARAAVLLVLLGLGVGVLTAVIGVGGGFIIVPVLVLLARLPMRHAVGTSLVIIALNALSGFAGYFNTMVVDWPLVGTFTALAAVGTVAGSYWSHRVPQAKLKQVFAYVLIAVALYVLYNTLSFDFAIVDA